MTRRVENVATVKMTGISKRHVLSRPPKKKKKEEKSKVALNAVSKSERINYESDWIIDSGYSNYMIGNIKKLDDLDKYKEIHVIVMTNNSKLSITYVSKATISHRFSSDMLEYNECITSPI
jgi:3-hydroxyacyl-CoA dehydrogenase